MRTTAGKLLAYRTELVAGGVNPTVADEMVRDAGPHLVETTGLVVEAPALPERRPDKAPAHFVDEDAGPGPAGPAH